GSRCSRRSSIGPGFGPGSSPTARSRSATRSFRAAPPRTSTDMTPSEIDTLFAHVYWIRDRILRAADAVDVPFVDASPPTLRDLRATLVHELDVEWSWRVRLSSEDRTAFSTTDKDLDPADFPSVAAIRARW